MFSRKVSTIKVDGRGTWVTLNERGQIKENQQNKENRCVYVYIYIYVLRMNKNHHKIQVRRSMMVKSKKDNAMKTSGKFTLAQGTARSQHLDEQLLSCMASRGASNGDVDSLISLLRWAGLRNPAGTTSPRRAMVMAKKVHHV